MFTSTNSKLNAKLASFRKKLSKSSIRVYSSTIKSAAKKFSTQAFSLDMRWVTPQVINKILQVKDITKRRNFLNALLIACQMVGKDSLATRIKGTLQSLRNEIKNKKSDQKMSAREKERALDWPNLQKRYRVWAKRLPSFTKTNWKILQRFVVASCYLLRAPLRLDWFQVSFSETDKNYLDLPQKLLVLNDFKTKSTYGEQKLKLGTALTRLLKKWMTLRESMGDNTGLVFLTARGKPFSRNGFGKLLSSIIEDLTNRKSSASFLRKAYISHIFRDEMSLKKRQEHARDMLHSVETQRLWYEKKS